jgi:ABC-type amino acid transport substrate-binding protein
MGVFVKSRIWNVACLLAAWLGVSGPLAGQPLAEAPRPTLVIAAEDGAGPWGQADGTGCGNDIVLAAFAAAKVQARLEVMPYARARNGVLSGTYVGCFGMAWTQDMEGKVVFADKPLYTVTAMLVQRTGAPLHASGPKDLPQDTKVGTVLAYEYPPAYYELVKSGQIVPMDAYSEALSLKNLEQKRVDAALVVIDELKSLDYLINEAGLKGKVGPAFAIGGQGTYIGFSRNHPQGEFARARFNEGYAIITKDGTLHRILETWKARR